MKKILIVEDEIAISELIAMNLKLAGFNYEQAFDGEEALFKIKNNNYDLVLLDIMIPLIDGLELIKYIVETPVIFITAINGLTTKLKGFELGANDYIVKPFETLELIARIKVALKYKGQEVEETLFKIKNVTVNIIERTVFENEKEIVLSNLEFNLLEMLINNKNIALSRTKILEYVWGYEYEGDTRTVDVHIQKLRKKLCLEDEIKTVYKYGYRLEVK